ncbi:MAG: Maf family protein [Candidatus Marinamargulisbacteria bacterium]
MPKRPIILASASSIRKQILEQYGFDFEVIPANINERTFEPLDATGLANAKALAISQSHPNAIVIGADQICHMNGRVFHKPGSVKNAIKTLQQLQGQTHVLLTAATIAINNQIKWSGLDEIHLTMRVLSTNEIENYINIDGPIHSCGAYKFESLGQTLFESVTHPSESIQGLPTKKLIPAIHQCLNTH